MNSYITPYFYYITISGDSPFMVYHNGSKYIIENREVCFSSVEKLTLRKFSEVIKGTKNIIKITGEFEPESIELKKIKIL